MSQLNPISAQRENAITAGNLNRLLNDVSFHANLIALRATVQAIRAGRAEPTRDLSAGQSLGASTIRRIAAIDQAAAALNDAAKQVRTAVCALQALAEASGVPAQD